MENCFFFFNSGVFRDIILNRFFSHPCIFRYDSLLYDNELGFYVVGERMPGTVFDVINDFDTDMFFLVLKDILMALKHIHESGMIHSDVKPANILYKKTV
mgnify:CR=1 FL=1